MPQFDASFFVGQIFWMLVSFGFLYLMMSQLICPMIEEVIQAREKRIQDDLDRAEKLNQEAEMLHQRYQTYQLSVERDKAQFVQEAYGQVQKKTTSMENKQDAQLRRKIQRAEQKIESATRRLKEESDVLSAQLADSLVDRLLSPKEEA